MEKCTQGELNKQNIDHLICMFDDHQRKQNASLDKIWVKLDQLGNRLPHWGVIAIAILTAIVGWFAK